MVKAMFGKSAGYICAGVKGAGVIRGLMTDSTFLFLSPTPHSGESLLPHTGARILRPAPSWGLEA